MRILVFGVGALGTVYSCLLQQGGHRVTGVAREPAAGIIRQNGAQVTGIWGKHRAVLDRVVSSVDELKAEEFDLVLLTVKSFATARAAEEVAKILKRGTLVVLLQNGLGNFEAAREHIPEDRLLLGRVIFGAERTGPGQSEVTVIADDVVLGSPRNAVEKQALEEVVTAMQEAGIPTRSSDRVMQYVWGKVIYNSALNPLGALLEVNYGRLSKNEHSRAIMDAVVEEIFAVMHASNQDTLWTDAVAYLADFYRELVPATASHHASMLQDIRLGRRTEIDALNGAIVRLGQKHGVPTPVNDFLTLLVKAKEFDKMTPLP